MYRVRVSQLLRSHKNFLLIFIILQCLIIHEASAGIKLPDLVYGGFIGFGGSGIEKTVVIEGTKYDLARSESPGMMGISAEAFISNKWSLAFSHRRGFRLGPFSTGAFFTGAIARRYFYNPPPFIPSTKLQNAITMQTWAPYIGLGSGIAHASTVREGDVISKVSSSAVYVGIHIGFDYQISPNLILRPEIFTSSSFMDVTETPATLEEFGVVCGFHFRL